MVLAAIVFFGKESVTVPGGAVVALGDDSDWIRLAYLTLAPLWARRWPARSSPWHCLPAGRAAPSPARWPGRS